MQECLFKGKIETCIICSYYFSCKARGEIDAEQEKAFYNRKLHDE